MTHIAEALPQNPEEVKARMNEMGITEDCFSAEIFYHHYNARNWLLRGEKIVRWSSLLICWQKYAEKKHGIRPTKNPKDNLTTSLPLKGAEGAVLSDQSGATADGSLPHSEGTGGGLPPRSAEVSSWLDCQYPMPEEPEKREHAEKLERCYSLQNQPQFGMYEHWKQILTSNTITLQAAVKHVGQGMVERIIIRHLDDLAAHFRTSLLSYSLHEMQQTARWMIEKAPTLKFAELMLICQRAKEERQLPASRVCRGDIKQLILNFPGWKRNALEFL